MHLAPSLTGQLGGIVLHDLSWHGRRYTVAIGPRTTTVTVTSGTALPVQTPAGLRHVAAGQPLTIATRRPDLAATTDAVRCGAAAASSSEPGAPALAAVDGSPATDWQPVTLPADTHGARHRWHPDGEHGPPCGGARCGRRRRRPPKPPPPGPVVTLRASTYTLAVSTDGRTWHTVATVTGRTTGTTDVLHLPGRPGPVRRGDRSPDRRAPPQPMLEELTVTR